LLGEVPALASDAILERVLTDTDARVRANAIEVLESKKEVQFLPMLAQRARSAHNRERANAIKAMHRMRVGTASNQLLGMLRDQRPEHRISAMWALRQTGIWQLLNEVGRIAKQDENLRVRRYALSVIKSAVEAVQASKQKVG
jgi:HEAT repeat protein